MWLFRVHMQGGRSKQIERARFKKERKNKFSVLGGQNKKYNSESTK